VAERWLSAEEQRAWRAFLAATSRIGEELDRQLQRDSGLPHAYYEVLVRLSEAPGRAARMSELARAAGSSRSRLSHAVARLERTGLVRRECAAGDRRGQVAVLTDEGFAVLAAAAPGHVACVRRLLIDPLTDGQLAALREICEAVLGKLGEVPNPPEGGG
jgi:DNA-binding MarR family transcriptional regulator